MKLGLSIGYSGAELRLPVDTSSSRSGWASTRCGRRRRTARMRSRRSRTSPRSRSASDWAPASCSWRRARRPRRHGGAHRRCARRWRPRHRRARRLRSADRGGLVRPAVGQAVLRACATTSRSCARSSSARSPVTHDGREISLPYTGAGRDRRGQAARVDPPHESRGCRSGSARGTEANVQARRGDRRRLAARWASCRDCMPMLATRLEEGFRRAGHGKGVRRLRDPAGDRRCAVTDDVAGALARMKPRVALYVGGMGHRDKNFHKEMMVRRGFGDAAAAHPGAVPRRRRKDEAVDRGSRRVLRRDGAGRPARAHRRALSCRGRTCGITGLTIHRRADGSDGADGGARRGVASDGMAAMAARRARRVGGAAAQRRLLDFGAAIWSFRIS